jgi:hypothetical protein
MPERVHRLLDEPRRGNLSVVMQALKQRVAARILDEHRARIDPAPGCLWASPLASVFRFRNKAEFIRR